MRRRIATRSSSVDPSASAAQEVVTDYCVVNFYHLVDLADPDELVQRHRRFFSSNNLDIRGRIYISPQGINCQCGGSLADGKAYAQWAEQQPEFQGLRYSIWPAREHMFPKLRLKLKPNLISLAGGMQALPITDPSQRATPLAPSEWKQMIAQAQTPKTLQKQEGAADQGIVVLDVRNDYEWDAGHFVGAHRPAEEVFAETPVGETEMDLPEPLKGADPDTPVMMYCTGGIRCDVYSTFLRQKGFNKLYTLEGGIQNYLKEQGSEHWRGSLFVFDGRMAIPADNPDAPPPPPPEAEAQPNFLPAAVPCQLCKEADGLVPHMNCANIDCNELFIACEACRAKYQGCCCSDCMTAPRLLRPLKIDGGHYQSWTQYADGETMGLKISTGRSKEGRVARRARRREVLKAKRDEWLAGKRAIKAAMKEAMRAQEAAAAAEQAAAEQAAAGQQQPQRQQVKQFAALP